MIVKGECKTCHVQGNIIDGISICAGCVVKARHSPGISSETKQALKWLLNVQYGALLNQPVKKSSMESITIELTDYCPHECKYCSSNATTNKNVAPSPCKKDATTSKKTT